MTAPKMIPFRGREVAEGWPERLAEAQDMIEVRIGRAWHRRIPYRPNPELPPDSVPAFCHDCSAVFGELHVPLCDMESCPGCGGQAIACPCRVRAVRYSDGRTERI